MSRSKSGYWVRNDSKIFIIKHKDVCSFYIQGVPKKERHFKHTYKI